MIEATDTQYNGWTNYQTWNVALWIQNDDGLYIIAKRHSNYADAQVALAELGLTTTPDGVRYDDPRLDTEELDAMLDEP